MYVEEQRGRVDNKFKPIKYRGEDGKGRNMPPNGYKNVFFYFLLYYLNYFFNIFFTIIIFSNQRIIT